MWVGQDFVPQNKRSPYFPTSTHTVITTRNPHPCLPPHSCIPLKSLLYHVHAPSEQLEPPHVRTPSFTVIDPLSGSEELLWSTRTPHSAIPGPVPSHLVLPLPRSILILYNGRVVPPFRTGCVFRHVALEFKALSASSSSVTYRKVCACVLAISSSRTPN